MNHFNKLLEETNQPKTLHGVQISVQDWQRATAFEMQDPDIPAPTFFDENGDPINIPSPPSRPQSLSRSPTPVTSAKDKGKGKEQHNDPLTDDIYKGITTETIVRPKRPALFIDTTPKEGPLGKDQDEPVIGATGQSQEEVPTIKKPTPGQFIRLQAIREGLRLASQQSESTTHHTIPTSMKELSGMEVPGFLYEFDIAKFE